MSHPTIPSLLAGSEPTFSFEFFPPKDDASEAVLWRAVRQLESVAPAFVSVTYGAGGSTRDRTVRVTSRIAHETTLRPMAHLTCVSSSVDELREVIGQYAAGGVRDVLALRGDPAGGPGSPWTSHPEGLDHAEELVGLLRSLGDFTVGVAAFPDKHPESRDLDEDADVLVRKFAAGAEFAITQFVFDVGSYTRLRDRVAARGQDAPIVPGIMPVTSFAQVKRMAELSGTPLPERIVARLAPLASDVAALRAEGVLIATELAEQLLREGAPGLHFYTMNRSTATLNVYRNLTGTAEVTPPPSAGGAAGHTGLMRGGAVAAVRRFVEAVQRGDLSAVQAAVTSDVVVELPGRQRWHGAAECLTVARGCPAAMRVERMVHDGGRQVVVWLGSGSGSERADMVWFVTLDSAGRVAAVVVVGAGDGLPRG